MQKRGEGVGGCISMLESADAMLDLANACCFLLFYKKTSATAQRTNAKPHTQTKTSSHIDRVHKPQHVTANNQSINRGGIDKKSQQSTQIQQPKKHASNCHYNDNQ